MHNNITAGTASDARQRETPPPLAAWLPGAALLWMGAWMVTDGGLDWGWALCAFGLTLVLIGAVAQGVAWGLGIHRDRHP